MNGTRSSASSYPVGVSKEAAAASSLVGGLPSEIRHTRLIDAASSGGTTTGYTTEDTTLSSGLNTAGLQIKSVVPLDETGIMDEVPTLNSVAQAALSAAKNEKMANRPKISYEVRPFTKESLEKINLRTSNLIRDYGFLPKRKPNLMDGAELPAKYEPFPPELLGKPVEEIDQYVYEKVNAFFNTFSLLSLRSMEFV